jgi:hypothetical protein
VNKGVRTRRDDVLGWRLGFVAVDALTPRERNAMFFALQLNDQDSKFYRRLAIKLQVAESTAQRYLTSARKKIAAEKNRIKPSDVVDIRTEMQSVCRKLELDPRWVRSLTLRPGGVKVEVYLQNENGEKYLDARDQPATETRFYVVIA